MTTQEHMGRIVETLLFSDKICDKMRKYAIRRVVEEHEAGQFTLTAKKEDTPTSKLLNWSFAWAATEEGHDWWATLSYRIFSDPDLKDDIVPELKKICRSI